MPGQGEEKKEKEKPDDGQNLNHAQDQHQPAQRRCSPNPERDHACNCDRFEDRQREIDNVRILELVMLRQPPAFDEVPVNRGRGYQMPDRTNNGFHQPTFFAGGSRFWFSYPRLELGSIRMLESHGARLARI